MKPLILLLSLLLSVLFAHASDQMGTIRGRVVWTQDSSPLKGVILKLAHVDLPRGLQTKTAADGTYRFKKLPARSGYRLQAEMDGVKPLVRESVTVTAGGETVIDWTLEFERIHVEPSLSPMPHPMYFSDNPATRIITFEEMQQLPTGRDPYSLLVLAPGVLVDRENSAGLNLFDPAGVVARGHNGDTANQWQLAGIDLGRPDQPGTPGMVWDFDAVEEMQVSTVGVDVARQTGGVRVNLIPRSGGDHLRWGGRFYYSGSSLQGDNHTGDLSGKVFGGDIDLRHLFDAGFHLGMPIVRDKLNVWGGLAYQNLWPADGGTNGEKHSLLTPTVNLNFFPSRANRLNAFFSATIHREERIPGPGPRNLSAAPISTYVPSLFDNYILKVSDEHILGNWGWLQLKWARSRFDFHYKAGDEGKLYRVSDLTTVGAFPRFSSRQSRNQVMAQFTLFPRSLGRLDQEILGGIEWNRASSSGRQSYYGNMWLYIFDPGNFFDFDGDGVNEPIGSAWSVLRIERPDMWQGNVDQISVYLQDRLKFGNFILQAGVRFDQYAPFLQEQVYDTIDPDHAVVQEIIAADARPLLDRLFPDLIKPALRPDEYRVPIWSPRLGIFWDIGGESRQVLMLTLARYGDQFGTTQSDFFGYQNSEAEVNFWWKDADGNGQASAAELYWYRTNANGGRSPYQVFDDQGGFVGDPSSALEYLWRGALTWGSSGSMTSESRYVDVDGKLRSPCTNEAVVSYSHEFGRDLRISLAATYRLFNGFLWNVPWNRVTGERFDNPTCFWEAGTVPAVLPGHPAWGDIETGAVAGRPYYLPLFSSGESGPYPDRLLTPREGYKRQYWGIDLSVDKKLAGNWMARGVFTLQNQWESYREGVGYADPTNIWALDGQPYAAFFGNGRVGQYYNSRWIMAISALYQLPWEMSVSALFTAREGNILERSVILRDDRAPDIASRQVRVLLEPFGATRMPALANLNLRLEKRIRLGREGSLYFILDLFNVLNSSTAQRQNQFQYGTWDIALQKWVNTTGNAGVIAELTPPRVLRLGLRFQF